MTRFFQPLESRQLLSFNPMLDPSSALQSPAILMPLAATLTNVVGTYTGSINVKNVHTQPVKVVIATQAADGTITGTLTSPNDSNLHVTVGGKVGLNNTITLTLGDGSGHAGGAIAGSGSGTITQTTTQTTINVAMNFTSPFLDSGTLTLSGPRSVVTSIVAKPAANQTAVAGTSKLFALGSFTQINATGPFTIDVNWGDGSAHTRFAQSAAGTIAAHTHAFTKAVTDVVSVIVTDSKGHKSNTAKFNVVVTPAAAKKLVFTRQPVKTVAGKAIAPAVLVAIEDAFGNVVTSNTSKVTISRSTGPTGSTLGGTLAVNAVKGVATFSTLVLKKAGTYTLKATDGLLASATSASFSVVAAAAAKVVFTRQPVKTAVGAAITPSVLVAIQDAFGNVCTTNTSKVTIARNIGPTGSILSGTLSVNAVKGLATFSNLKLNKAGTYTLKATDGLLTSATSSSFAVA